VTAIQGVTNVPARAGQGDAVTLPPEAHAGGPIAVYEGYMKMRQVLLDQHGRLENNATN
jgi:hypothetical protein